MMPTPRAVNRVPSSRILFMRSGDDQIRHHRKMIAGPNPVDGLCKRQLTGGDLQRGAAPLSTSHEDVVDPLKGFGAVKVCPRHVGCLLSQALR